MDLIDRKDGNRKIKLIACKNCKKEWAVRKDRTHSGLCRRCRFLGDKNPLYGKTPHNKGFLKHGMSYTKYRWIEHKKEIVLLMGNQCMMCKERNMPIYCYELHHTDRENKKFSVLSKMTGWRNSKVREQIMEELKKCKLICKNCHSILHYGLDRAEEVPLCQ